MGKSNEEKRQEIKAMKDRFKEKHDLEQQQTIDTLNEMFDTISPDDTSDEKQSKLLEIIDKYGQIEKTDNVKKLFLSRTVEFRTDFKKLKNKILQDRNL